jgi:hypothetical protein
MQSWKDWSLSYYNKISQNWTIQGAVSPLLPYQEEECKRVRACFYSKYYNDTKKRQLWLGINPGRFGAGITGIPFSDPVHLKEICNIDNSWDMKTELSAAFIFEVIQAMGGPEYFYNKVFIDSICPVGFTKDGINFNYYDKPKFFQEIKTKLNNHLSKLEERPLLEKVVIIGKGKNEDHFKKLDQPFSKFVSLPHPRWIMQYRRKEKEQWIDRYVNVLEDKT